MSIVAKTAVFLAFSIVASSFWGTYELNAQVSKETEEPSRPITEQEVALAQKAWGEGIVNIGKIYLDKGDYKKAASDLVSELYNYQEGSVLFKPTLASEYQFRTDFEGALSYFVGHDDNYQEDHGFAIKPWSKVRMRNVGVKIKGNMAIAMGVYHFTPAKGGEDTKADYTFAYTKDDNGKLKIILHDSHLPYKPPKKSP